MTIVEQFLAAVRARRRARVAVRALPARRLLALPAPPGVERGPVCVHCGHRHPPVRRRFTWSTPIDGSAEEGRPRPLRDQADVVSVYRDQFTPWRTHV